MPESGSPGAEAPATRSQTLIERRRPGRVQFSNPAVIALMRSPTTVDPTAPADIPGPFEADDSDSLAPARGILAGLVLALPLWALIGAGAWLLLLD